MKATQLLKDQHAEVKTLFKKLESGKGDLASFAEKLADSLAAHMVIEQEIFYPAVLDVKEDLVRESYEEHACARFALKRLMKTDPSDENFQAKVTTLKELIEHHVEEEEEDLFPKAEKALGERSEQLCVEMKKVFAETVKLGFKEVVSKGGPAVTSAVPPHESAHA